MNREDINNLNEIIKTKVSELNEVRLKDIDDVEKLQRLNYLYGYRHCIDECFDESNTKECWLTNGSIYDNGNYIPLTSLKMFRDKIEYTIKHYDELLYEAMLNDNKMADAIIVNYNASHKKQIKI